MHNFSDIKEHVIKKLEDSLPSFLTYHNIAHTLDVLEQTIIIARDSGVKSEEDLLLLKVAALYHDTGFIYAYNGHEERSCEIAQQDLPAFGFSPAQIEKICGMIRATKIPQNPKTPFEKIICDADLDYLGRFDFYSIGDGLYNEFLHQKVVSNELEWNQLQIKFLQNHSYCTDACRQKRDKIKQQHLAEVKRKVEGLTQQMH